MYALSKGKEPRALGHVPLLWILLALATGYSIGEFLKLPPLFPLVLGTCSCLGVWWAKNNKSLWNFSFFVGASSLFCTYYYYRLPVVDPITSSAPPREVEVTVQLQRILQEKTPKGYMTGYGLITDTDRHLIYLKGKRFYFILKPTCSGPFIRTQQVRMQGVLEKVGTDGTNSFDRFLHQNHVYLKLSRGSLQNIIKPETGLEKHLNSIYQKLEALIKLGVNSKTERYMGIYQGMLLGKTQCLTQDQKNAFIWTGTMHLFSISGLHIGVIALALATFLEIFRLPYAIRFSFVALILLLYVEATGSSPPAWRSYLMILFWWGGRWVNRKGNSISILLAAAVPALIVSPTQLWDPGFQMSYGIVASILLYGVPLTNWIREYYNQFKQSFSPVLQKIFTYTYLEQVFSPLCVSFSASLMSFPMVVFYFGILTPGSILVNIILIPLSSLAIIAGCLSLGLGLLGLKVGTLFFNYSAWTVIACMEAIIKPTLHMPALYYFVQFHSGYMAPLIVITTFALYIIGSYFSNQRWRYWAPLLPLVVALGINLL